MSARGYRPGSEAGLAAALALAMLAGPVCAGPVCLGQAKHGPAPEVPPVQPIAPAAGQQVMLDSVVAIVNGDLILESDVDAEERFGAFQPFNESKPETRQELVERLIDRALILQQMALQPEPPIPDAQLERQLATLRKAIPNCAAYHCETDAGWEKFVAGQGFTMAEVSDRWRQRMAVLRFIEERFRMGIRIEQSDIDDYYRNTMLPVYEKQKVTPPAEAAIADRIQEILLQQRVNKLMDDWLTALRAEGSVRMMKPGEEAP
jgi:peptidyl-prolyl cis-trans isomerase SurA